MHKPKASQFTTAIAVYKPTESDQISLEEGDFVEILNKSEDQEWWYGQKVRGKKTGWFPSTFVKQIGGKVEDAKVCFLGALQEKNKQNVNRRQSIQPAHKLNEAENLEFRSKLELVLQKNPEPKKSVLHNYQSAKNNEHEERVPDKNTNLVVAVAAYLATSPDQLNLKIGDIIDVDKETTSGWSNGTILNCSSRRHGWFPTSYVKTLGTEYRPTELSSILEYKEYTEIDDHDKGNFTDQSFESDDSDYESGTHQSSNGKNGTQQETSLLKGQLLAPKMPIAMMSLESIDAVQLYTQNRSFPMYLNLCMATEWQNAPAVLTTKSAKIKPASAFYSTTSIYSAEWIANFRLNIFSASESLLIQCCAQTDHQNELINCLAEARMPVFDLIKQSRHLKKFTKGLPIKILDTEALVPSKAKIKPCFLVKFDIIEFKN